MARYSSSLQTFAQAYLATILLWQGNHALAEKPEYSVENGQLVIQGFFTDCPIIYDNDWWKDVPDAAYLWAQASLGHAQLKGNVVSRDMWNWQEGYTYSLQQCLDDARSLFDAAKASGLRHIPAPIAGADAALVRPANGKIEDTRFKHSPGSELILQEARKASTEKPLLVFAGGPCTTVATAYLADPSIAERMIVFQIDGGAYNGKDAWSWEIVKKRCRFANWAKAYFWGDWSRWQPDRFDSLPENALGLTIKKYARSELGKANQWGDGAWIFQLFAPGCITNCEDYDGAAITVPRHSTNPEAMADEFFKILNDPRVYHEKAS